MSNKCLKIILVSPESKTLIYLRSGRLPLSPRPCYAPRLICLQKKLFSTFTRWRCTWLIIRNIFVSPCPHQTLVADASNDKNDKKNRHDAYDDYENDSKAFFVVGVAWIKCHFFRPVIRLPNQIKKELNLTWIYFHTIIILILSDTKWDGRAIYLRL